MQQMQTKHDAYTDVDRSHKQSGPLSTATAPYGQLRDWSMQDSNIDFTEPTGNAPINDAA